MADTFQKPNAPSVSLKRRLAKLLLLLLLATAAALWIEHWRGERALRAWKDGMTARGEILDLNKLWPAPQPASREFYNQLTGALERLPKRLNGYGGALSGLGQDESGHLSRGSKLANPPFLHGHKDASTWRDLEIVNREAQPALESIRKLMRNPPRVMEIEIKGRLDPVGIPGMSHVRRSSHALHLAALTELHRGDLAAALANLEALQGCVRLYADDPALMTYMVRIAVIGLGTDAGWDALQEDRWTEPQLLRLQQACRANVLFPQMPNVLAGERVARLHSMDWFASHHYQDWIDYFSDIHKAFGSTAAEMDTANWNGLWRKRIFHPTWSYAWRAQDELAYLKYSQQEMDILREAVKRGSWSYLQERQTEVRNNYQRPVANWRFYHPLPLHDILGEIVGAGRTERPESPYPDFSRAWLVTAQHLTRQEMVNTMIALKRYRLREGKMPKELGALVPAYTDALPRDLVDGQPLRYRLNTDGTFVLYSVGEDAQDDGGDSRPSASSATRQTDAAWSGRDWVWPQAPAAGKRPGA